METSVTSIRNQMNLLVNIFIEDGVIMWQNLGQRFMAPPYLPQQFKFTLFCA